MPAVSRTLLPMLYGLNTMLQKFWPEHAMRNEIALAFWQMKDDSLLFDALQYLPSNIYTLGGQSGRGHTEEEIENLPEGFRILVPIFHLEDEFANEGWSGLANLGVEGIAKVIDAYEAIGLRERGKALRRVFTAFQKDLDDELALKKAAGDGLPDLVDDDQAFQLITKFIRTDSERRFGTLPSDV